MIFGMMPRTFGRCIYRTMVLSVDLDEAIFARANDHIEQFAQRHQPPQLRRAQLGDERVAERAQRVAARTRATRHGWIRGQRKRVHTMKILIIIQV